MPCPDDPRDPRVHHPGVLGMSDAGPFSVPVGKAWHLRMPRVGCGVSPAQDPVDCHIPTLCQDPRAGARAMVADQSPVVGMARRVPSASMSRSLWWKQAARLHLSTTTSSGPAGGWRLLGREAPGLPWAAAVGFQELLGALFAGSKAGGRPEPPALPGRSTSWGQI